MTSNASYVHLEWIKALAGPAYDRCHTIPDSALTCPRVPETYKEIDHANLIYFLDVGEQTKVKNDGRQVESTVNGLFYFIQGLCMDM